MRAYYHQQAVANVAGQLGQDFVAVEAPDLNVPTPPPEPEPEP